ncbi:MAG: hypothetical protein AMXMBFR64_04280 [Myxococcales bacterium]
MHPIDTPKHRATPLRGPVCLVRPPAVESFRFVTTTITLPLGLAYIAAALEEAGRPVHLLDSVAEDPKGRTRYFKGVLVGLPLEAIAARVPAESCIVGITVVFTHEWPAVVRLIELIKARLPDMPVVVGGEHVTSMPEFCLATSKADFIVTGEGEESVIELLDALESGRPLQQVDGIGFRDHDSFTVNRRRARRKDVDAIPYPAWHLFDIKAYNDSHLVGGMQTGRINLPLLATRGCPYQCTFCSSPNMWNPRWIPRDPIKVVDEIEHHLRQFGASSFPFQDLTAIVQKDWIVAFCKEILRRKLDVAWQFPSGTRSEAIDAEVADLMRRTGMVSIAYAPESGSERTRKLIKKRMRTDHLLASIGASVEAELNVACFLIIGFPHDTEEDLTESLEFAAQIRRMGVTDLGVGYFFALPGTELFDALYDAGKIKLDGTYFAHILQGGDLVPSVSHSELLSRFDLVKWKARIYTKFYGTRVERKARTSLVDNVRRAVSGLLEHRHESKLQTVFRTGMHGAWNELRLAHTVGWIPREEERALFARWDDIYRRIRQSLLDKKLVTHADPDTTQIHHGSVMTKLKAVHQTGRTLDARAVGG